MPCYLSRNGRTRHLSKREFPNTNSRLDVGSMTLWEITRAFLFQKLFQKLTRAFWASTQAFWASRCIVSKLTQAFWASTQALEAPEPEGVVAQFSRERQSVNMSGSEAARERWERENILSRKRRERQSVNISVPEASRERCERENICLEQDVSVKAWTFLFQKLHARGNLV